MARGALAVFPGANGQIAVVHLSGAPGSSQDIFAIGPTGQNRVQLTNTPDDDAFPSYSADGERIVFSRGAAGSAGSGQVWIMNADGSDQTQLTHGSPTAESPTFSPDGTRIAFTRDGQLWIMNADGSGQTQLTATGPNHGPSFSPDGTRIAFSHFNGAAGYHEISLINPDGSGQIALTTPSAASDDFQPDFSPDGQRIVFDRYDQSQDDLWIMNADGSGQAPLTSGNDDWDLSPAFAPDGEYVVFERDAPGFTVANIFTVDLTGLNETPTPLTSNAAPVQDFEPGWQPLNPASCDLDGQKSSKSVKRLKLTVTCANENATVTARGTGTVPEVRGWPVAAKTTKFKLPAMTVKAPAGKSTKFKLKVSRKGQQALAEALEVGQTGKAKITTTATDDLGQTARDSLKIKFKRESGG